MDGVRLTRQKRRHLWLSVLYRLQRWLPIGPARRLDLYLNLHWLFGRLAHEASHRLYSSAEHPLRAGTWEFLEPLVPQMQRVLDLGCGTGELTRLLAPHVETVVGVDHNAAVLATAEARTPHASARFVCGDATAYLRSVDTPFDTLILSHVLEHLDSPGPFLREVSGQFEQVFVEVPDFDASGHQRLRKLRGLDLIYQDEDHISEFARADVLRLLDEAGLKVVVSDYRQGVQRFWCHTERKAP